MNNSLIDRLQEYRTHCNETEQHQVCELIGEAIEALKFEPVEDDDVKDTLSAIASGHHTNDGEVHGYDYHSYLTINEALTAAEDIIERLAREKGEAEGKLIATEKGCVILAESLRESDQRIEELKARHRGAMSYIDGAKLDIETLQAKVDELRDGNEYTLVRELRAKVDRLEAEVDRYREAFSNAADGIDRIALSIPPPNEHTPRLKMWAIEMRNEIARIATAETPKENDQ